MTDQPRLSERLAKAARAIDLSQPYPVYGARMNALYELVLDVAIPDLQALEAREERLTAALENMGFDIDALLAESHQEGAER